MLVGVSPPCQPSRNPAPKRPRSVIDGKTRPIEKPARDSHQHPMTEAFRKADPPQPEAEQSQTDQRSGMHWLELSVRLHEP